MDEQDKNNLYFIKYTLDHYGKDGLKTWYSQQDEYTKLYVLTLLISQPSIEEFKPIVDALKYADKDEFVKFDEVESLTEARTVLSKFCNLKPLESDF